MIPSSYIRHPYTQACQDAGHTASSTGLACKTCRYQAGRASKLARGKAQPLLYPYTQACQDAQHSPTRTGQACLTCRARGNWIQRGQAPQPTIPPVQTPAPPSNGNGHHPTTAWIEWGQEIVDALILQSHAVPQGTDPLRPEYVQQLIDRRPR